MSTGGVNTSGQNPTNSVSQYALNQFESPMDAGVFSLTPEALLTYCQTQLRSLDADVEKYMKDQRAQLAKKAILQKLETATEDNTTVDKSGDTLTNRQQNIANAYHEAYENLEAMGMDDQAQAVKEQFDKAFPNGDITKDKPSIAGCKLTGTLAQSAFDNYTSPLKDMIDEIGKNAELNMIQLQSIVSQRQTAVQLTTNMMSKLDRGYDAITANFK